MRARRSVAVAAMAVGAPLALAGCGSSSAGSGSAGVAAPSPLDAVLAADQRTVAERSAHLSLREQVGVAGHTITVTGTGAESFVQHRSTFVTSVLGQSLQLRTIGSTLYEKLPAVAESALGGKPWLAVDLDALSRNELGATLSQLQQSSQTDPATLLSYLSGVAANGVHRHGTATVRGVATTRYDATVDLNKLAASRSGAAAVAIKRLTSLLGTSSYPMSVWVDSHGAVRQLSFALATTPSPTLTKGRSIGAVTFHATLQLFDFGAPVVVAAPPASQTTRLTGALLKRLSGAAGALGSSTGTGTAGSGT